VRGPIRSSFAGLHSTACAESFDGSTKLEIFDMKGRGLPHQAREVDGMLASPAETSTDNAVTPNKSMTAHPELKSLQ